MGMLLPFFYKNAEKNLFFCYGINSSSILNQLNVNITSEFAAEDEEDAAISNEKL